uniref:LRRCT domain-containing protein n=1 Tax=Denticeps clupeoides TaxID=299321 RepID=A0AAY4EKE5_9TELE
ICPFVLCCVHHCPRSCTCAEDSATVSCPEWRDGDVPVDVPVWASTLDARGGNVSALPAGAFCSNGTELELVSLLLSRNGIRAIGAHAFLGLPRLELLDLSYNRLRSVSADAFHGLRELRYLYLNGTLGASAAAELPGALASDSLRNLLRLELSGNRLKTIPLASFETLNLHALVLTNNSLETVAGENVTSLGEFRSLRVYLALNPFRCACELQAFYHWLKNSSQQCPDMHRLLCAQPDERRGQQVEKLRREDVECASAELEAVSYVFLGIVLALIGVVFLMVLYLNRGGIKRWLNNIREACRDQMEVYHYRYEQDSDPRLANVAV